MQSVHPKKTTTPTITTASLSASYDVSPPLPKPSSVKCESDLDQPSNSSYFLDIEQVESNGEQFLERPSSEAAEVPFPYTWTTDVTLLGSCFACFLSLGYFGIAITFGVMGENWELALIFGVLCVLSAVCLYLFQKGFAVDTVVSGLGFPGAAVVFYFLDLVTGGRLAIEISLITMSSTEVRECLFCVRACLAV